MNISVDSLHVQALVQLIVVKAEHPLNILLISVTFSVLNLVRSSDISDSQPQNIPFISVTFDVLRLSSPSIAASFEQSLNQDAVEVGR